jgi:hypothetical protein
MRERAVGNTLAADGTNLLVITGANQGGVWHRLSVLGRPGRLPARRWPRTR